MLPPDLPPISNRALYAYRVLGKWFSFFFFGSCSLALGIVILPFLRLIFHPKKRFQRVGRALISNSLKFFIFIMRFIRVVKLEVEDRERYKKLSSKIIVANHPSILDVIMLFSIVPNADCIVNSNLNNGILKGIIRLLYILNSLDLDKFFKACCESLENGNNIIIFPEGTRTPRSGKIKVKKGAARISFISGCNIVPVHIGGTDKFGLGKKDPWTGFNPTQPYIYHLSIGDEVSPEKYRNLSTPLAVRAITREFSAFLYRSKEIKDDD